MSPPDPFSFPSPCGRMRDETYEHDPCVVRKCTRQSHIVCSHGHGQNTTKKIKAAVRWVSEARLLVSLHDVTWAQRVAHPQSDFIFTPEESMSDASAVLPFHFLGDSFTS